MHFNIIADNQDGYVQNKNVWEKFQKHFVVYLTCSQVWNGNKKVLATIMVAKTFKIFAADLFSCEPKRRNILKLFSFFYFTFNHGLIFAAYYCSVVYCL